MNKQEALQLALQFMSEQCHREKDMTADEMIETADKFYKYVNTKDLNDDQVDKILNPILYDLFEYIKKDDKIQIQSYGDKIDKILNELNEIIKSTNSARSICNSMGGYKLTKKQYSMLHNMLREIERNMILNINKDDKS